MSHSYCSNSCTSGVDSRRDFTTSPSQWGHKVSVVLLPVRVPGSDAGGGVSVPITMPLSPNPQFISQDFCKLRNPISILSASCLFRQSNLLTEISTDMQRMNCRTIKSPINSFPCFKLLKKQEPDTKQGIVPRQELGETVLRKAELVILKVNKKIFNYPLKSLKKIYCKVLDNQIKEKK